MNRILIVESNKQFSEKFANQISVLEKSNFIIECRTYVEFYKCDIVDTYTYSFIEVTEDDDLLSDLEKKLENNTGAEVYLLFNTSKVSQNNRIAGFFSKFKFLKGFIDYSVASDFYTPVFSELHLLNTKNIEQNNVVEIKTKLEKNVGRLREQLELVKEIHTKVVPKRELSFKGLSLKTKFMAGSTAGGEFFDIIEKNGTVAFILTSTKSYLVSTIILSAFSQFSEALEINLSSFQEFCKKVMSEIDDDNLEVDILLCLVDTSDLRISGYNFGSHCSFSLNKEVEIARDIPLSSLDFKRSFFDYTLKREDKLMILSAGYIYNLESKNYQEVEELIEEKLADSVEFDFINDLFFNISSDSQFLTYDASCIYLEVDKNAIFKI